MNRAVKKWLLLLMIPFFAGVIVHFIVPLQMIVRTNPKLEETFNGYKIEVEQTTVRSLTFLNGRVLSHRLQVYKNLHSTFIRMISRKEPFDHSIREVPLYHSEEVAKKLSPD